MSTQFFRTKKGLHLTPQATEPTGLELGDLWMDAEGTLKRWDGTASQDVGSGGVGSVDIMFADTFDATNISEYTTTGTVAVTDNVLEVIQGKKSLKITHTGGASAERIIPVDIKFRNKNVTFSFDVESDALSGNLTLTVTDNTNTVTLINAESIQPQGSLDTSIKRSVSFIIPDDCEELKYRFNAVSESAKISIIDNVVIELTQTAKMSTTIEVPVVTDWVDAGALQITATTTNPTKGTTAVDKVWVRRNGTNMDVRFEYRQTTAGTAGSGDYLYAIPSSFGAYSGLQIDSMKLTPYTTIEGSSIWTSNNIVGSASINGPTANGEGSVLVYDSAKVRIGVIWSSGSAHDRAVIGSGAFPLSDTSHRATATFSVPIVGWSATETQEVSLAQAVLKQESDSALTAKGNAGQVTTSLVTDIPFIATSMIGDAISWSGSALTVLKAGVFTIDTQLKYTGQVERCVNLYVNNIRFGLIGESLGSSTHHGSYTGYFNVGDVVSIRTSGNGGTLLNSTNEHYLTVAYQGSLKQINVTENQKIEIPTSELRMEGASTRGTGSDSAIVRFDTIAKLRGDAFTVESTAALGTRITMKKKGVLTVNTGLQFNTGLSLAISLNQVNRTALPLASEILSSGSGTAEVPTASWTGSVNVGDIIRVCANGNPSAAPQNILNLSFQEQEIAVSVTNVLPQFSESDSSVRVSGAAGFSGTTRLFSNVIQNIGNAIDYVPASGQFIAKESGIYNVSFTEQSTANTLQMGVNISVAGSLVAYDNQIYNTANTNAKNASCSWQGYLNQGDVVIATVNNTADNNGSDTRFTISKVGKPNVTGVDVTPFAAIEYEVNQFIESLTSTSTFGSTRTGVPVLNITKNTNNGLIRVDSSAANGTEFVALKRCQVTIHASATSDPASLFITKNSTIFTLTDPDGTIARNGISTSAGRLHCGATIELNTGDIVRVQRNNSVVTPITQVLVTATELRDAYQVIGGGVENTYSARITSAGAITSQSYPFIASVTKGSAGIYTLNLVPGFFTVAPNAVATNASSSISSTDRVAQVTSSTTTSIGIITNGNGTLIDYDFNIMVQRQGSDYRTPSKAIGLPQQRIAVLRDEKANNTAPQTVTTAYAARHLNTLEDPTGIVTNAASFTGVAGTNTSIVLEKGKYHVRAMSQYLPSASQCDGKIRLYNVTDLTTIDLGCNVFTAGNNSDDSSAHSLLESYFELTSQKTLELQMRVSVATRAGGRVTNFGENEVYSYMVITKLEE